MLPAFALARPHTVAEAVELLSEERVPFCGGTELLIAMKLGLLRPETLVDLKRIEELRGITRQDDQLLIGSATNHTEVMLDPLVRGSLPLLAQVEEKVGNPRVRSQGTIGGNVCFAESRSDVTTALVALEASVTLVSDSGRREIAVADFLKGPYWTDRQPDELLVRFNVPIQDGRRGVYVKYQTMERPTLGVALLNHGNGSGYRLVVGAVGEMPVTLDYTSLEEIEPEDVAARIEPIPDLAGTELYKRHVTAVYVDRAVSGLAAQEGRDDT